MVELVIWEYVLWSCSHHSTHFKIWFQNFMTIMDIKTSVKLPSCSFISPFQSPLGSLHISSNMSDIKRLCFSVHLVMPSFKQLDCWLLHKFKLIIHLFGSLLMEVPVFADFLLLLYGLHKVLIPVKWPVKREKVKYLDFSGLWWWLHKF